MYRFLDYIIITSRTVGLTAWTSYCNVPGEQNKGLRHFNTEEKKAEIISFPGPSPNPNPNTKHQALTIWLQVTADDCGALHCL